MEDLEEELAAARATNRELMTQFNAKGRAQVSARRRSTLPKKTGVESFPPKPMLGACSTAACSSLSAIIARSSDTAAARQSPLRCCALGHNQFDAAERHSWPSG
jgi:hypothetical protein